MQKGNEMKKVAIVTGSGHGLPEEIVKEYNINIVPFGISIGNESYKDGFDITADELIKMIYEKKINPKTSALNTADLINTYKSLKQEGKSVISIFTSSKLSAATFEAAKNAKENVGEEDIEIVDSLQAGSGKELIVLEAAKLAKEGKSKEEVLEHTRKVISRTNIIYGIHGVMYL